MAGKKKARHMRNQMPRHYYNYYPISACDSLVFGSGAAMISSTQPISMSYRSVYLP